MILRHLHQIVFVILGLSAIAGVLAYTYATNIDGRLINKPIEIYGDVQTERQYYRPGETVYGTVAFCKSRNTQAVFQWHIVDTYLKVYPEKKSQLAVGCHNVLMEIEVIPKDQRPSPVYFETILRYKINEFNTVEVPLKSNTFTVVL